MRSTHDEHCTDGELWQKVVAGDERAFEAVYERHVAKVYRCCRTQLQSTRNLADVEARAEEVTSEVFLTAWRRRASIQVEDSLAPWLLATAVALCRNNTRTEQRRHRLLTRIAQVFDRERTSSTAELVAGADAVRHVLGAVNALGPAEAQIADLCIVRDLSTRQAAGILSIAEGTAKSRLHRARAELRRTCEPVLYFDPRRGEA